jgi:hypothetical protein
MQQGRLIVLEGVDGSGTTTHTRLLCGHLRELDVPVHQTAQPSQGPIGGLLRQALTGRVVVSNAAGGARPPAWTTMALLFAADRMDHLESELEPNLSEGITVVCDRYDHSSVARERRRSSTIQSCRPSCARSTIVSASTFQASASCRSTRSVAPSKWPNACARRCGRCSGYEAPPQSVTSVTERGLLDGRRRHGSIIAACAERRV